MRTVRNRYWKQSRPRRPGHGWAAALPVALLCASMLTLGAGAAADLPSGPLSLSLEDAVARGLEHGTAVRLAELDLERARVSVEQARDAAKAIAEATTLDLARVKELVPRQAEMGALLAEKGLAAARDNAALGVRQAYFGTVLARDVREVRRLAVRLAEEQVAAARAGFRSGSRARADVLAAEAQLATARADLATAEKDYRVALMGLNKALGLPLATELELITRPTDRPPAPVELGQAVAAAEAASLPLQQAREEVAVAELDRSLAERYGARNTYAYRLADAALRQAEARLAERRAEVELAVRKALLEIAAAQERIAQQKKAVEAAEEALRLANLRYAAGLGTTAEVLDAQVRASGARAALANALFGYEMALAQFDVLTGKGAPGVAGGSR